MSARFRFRPRYRGVAIVAMGVGGALTALAGALGFLVLPLATGAVGILLGGGYLLSPSWRLAVTVDADGLEVGTPTRRRFRLAWTEVARLVASPTTHTCFVDGGSPERSLLVPGDGAPAPYDIENRTALYDAIVAAVPKDKVETVATLEMATAASPRR
ncbi:MAG: hypothetical protein NT062_14445 [Proteobacteria bacterium]|nr:hypothetical protein [Pseudomonadota bacterium]